MEYNNKPVATLTFSAAACKFFRGADRFSRRLLLSASVLTLGVTMCSTIARADSLWTGAVDSDWYNDGNWSPAAQPTDAAVIDGNTTPVILNGGPGAALSGTLTVGNLGNANFSILSGGTLTSHDGRIGVENGSFGVVSVTGTSSQWSGLFNLSVGGAGSGVLYVGNGGHVQAAAVHIGSQPDGSGAVIVTGAGSSFDNSAARMTVGGAGAGMLTISDQGRVRSYDGVIADYESGVGTATITGAGSQWTVDKGLFVGRRGEAYLDIQDRGVVRSEAGIVGEFAGSSGTVTIEGRSEWVVQTDLQVGREGTGTVILRNHGQVLAADGYIGWGAGSSGAVELTGQSTWFNAADLTIGRAGSGVLNISGGSLVENFTGVIGHHEGSSGTVTVEGALSQWTNFSDLYVGDAGSGTLNILNGGRVESQEGFVGNAASGTGKLLLDGVGSEWRMPGNLVIGQFGVGEVTVSGAAGLYNKDAVLGAEIGSKGSALISGQGSFWGNTGFLTVGQSGVGHLVVRGGGGVTSANAALGATDTGVGIVEIEGPDSRWDLLAPLGSHLSVGKSGLGMLTLRDGGSLTSFNTTLGDGAGSVGVITVTGDGSRWENEADLYVGHNGTGSLTVTDKGQVETYNATIGNKLDSVGQILVAGPGSVLTVHNRLDVGMESQEAELAIREGGLVESNTATLGVLTGSVGTASVIGAGSQWNNTFGLVIGQGGTGRLLVAEGGKVVSEAGYIGDVVGSAGIVVVDGLGSSWANDGNLVVGSDGSGTVGILNGGSVSNESGLVGRFAGSTGTVVVDSAGSTWTNRDLLVVGNEGSGELTISNGSVVSAGSTVNIATVTGSTGAINIGSARGQVATGAGVLDTPVINFGAGTGSLNFNHTDTNYLFAAKLTGAGTVNHLNGVTVTTGQSDTFSGPTSVTGGALVVEGSLGISTVTVSDHGVLAGTGSIGGLVADAGGVIAPGRSIGTLNVAGNVLFNPNSFYAVEIEPGGASDLIAAGGMATLNGGTVVVQSASGTYNLGTRYTILTAQGGVGGTFDEAIGTRPTPFLAFDLTYDPTNVFLDVARSNVTFASVGMTPNQIATGGGADSLPVGHPVLDALVQLDVPQAQHAFDQLSGEIHASAKTAMIEDSRFVRNAVNDRLRAAFDRVGAANGGVVTYVDGKPVPVAANTNGLAVWGQGFGSWGHTAGDGNAARLNRSIGGFFVGADAPVFDTWRFGAVAGYSRSSFDVKDRYSSGSSDNYHLGLYGGTSWGDLALRTGAAYTWHDVTTNRSVIFPGFSDSLRGDYNAGTAQVFGELGYGITAGTARFEPFANLAYVSVHTDGFTEHGGAAALSSQGTTTDATFTTLGLRASTTFDMGGSTLMAKGMIGWRHAFGDVAPLSTMRFAGAGDAFTIAGVPIARDAAVIEAGLDYAITPSATLGVTYGGQFGSGTADQSLKANFNLKF